MEAPKKKKTKVYMGICSVGNIVDSQTYFLREIEETYKDHIEFYYPSTLVRRKFHDFARNMVVEDFLSTDCDILWFLDSDITPNLHVLDLVSVYGPQWQVAGAPYPVFMAPTGQAQPEVVMTVYGIQPKSGNLCPANVPKEGYGWVTGVATGCLFIKREVFSLLERPYFEFKFEHATRNLIEGEDLGFINKLRKLRIQTFIDFSAVCRHEKMVDLLDVNNYAIAYANRSIVTYNEALREQLQAVNQKAFDAGFKKGFEAAEAEARTQKSPLWTPDQKAKLKGFRGGKSRLHLPAGISDESR